MLKLLSTYFKNIFSFEDFLYVLQLEEYDNIRYLKRLPRFFFRRNLQKRDTLKFTSRIQTTFMLSVGLYLLSMLFLIFSWWLFVVFTFAIPLYISLANNLLTPFYEIMKYRLQKKASFLIQKHPQLQIIAIAGSYGKTTTKNFIYELVKYNFKTQMVPGNINTPTGIAAWVLKNFDSGTEILIVEMDAYFIGEIQRSCMITTPTISVITSIGDQHIERFGSQRNMAQAILEVSTYSSDGAPLIIHKKDVEILSNFLLKTTRSINTVKMIQKSMKTNIKSVTALHDLELALVVAKLLKIAQSIIKDTLTQLSQPERRQKANTIQEYKALDDSYNISFTTACAGVREAAKLAKQNKQRLLVITAGIPEVGEHEHEVNRTYGAFLAKHADQVIALKSLYEPDVNSEKSFMTANTLEEAWSIAKKQCPPNKFFLLMQPELTDLYY